MNYIPGHQEYLTPVPEINKIDLKNGAELFLIRRGTVPAVKLELMYPAGRPFERKKGLSSATLQLLKSGTTKKSATRLADGFDHWGSSLNLDFYIDNCGVKLFALEKYLPKVLLLLHEMLTTPSFPITELKLYQRQQKEKLRSDEARADVLAYRMFTEYLFGKKHPYGYNSSVESIEAIQRQDLIQHHKSCYDIAGAKIFLAGSYTDHSLSIVSDILSSLPTQKNKSKSPKTTSKWPIPGRYHIAKQDAVQSSIRLGRRMFTRNHPDFVPLFVLNTLLGGYYGSRLMQNLREKRGLTYHIYSTLDTFLLDGYFLISTEVDKSRSALALKEIYKELARLRDALIKPAELKTVKAYLKGSFLNYFENVFAQSELIRTLSLEGGVQAYTQLVTGIESVTSADIQMVANKYLREDALTLVTVG